MEGSEEDGVWGRGRETVRGGGRKEKGENATTNLFTSYTRSHKRKTIPAIPTTRNT